MNHANAISPSRTTTLRGGRSRTSRNRILCGPLAPAKEVRIRRRAFLRATRCESVVAPPPAQGASNAHRWVELLAAPTTASVVVVALVAFALFLDPHGPLVWLNALRACALGIGILYLCWFSLHEARLDRLHLPS